MSEYSLIYPTLELFLYDFREGLGQTPTGIDENRKNFLGKIYPKIEIEEKIKKITEVENPEADYVFLLGSDKTKKFDAAFDDHYFPVQLGDTYALRVGCSGKYADSLSQEIRNFPAQPVKNSVNAEQIPDFTTQPVKDKVSELKKIIVSKIHHQETTTDTQLPIQSTLGQTWLLWGQLTPANQDAEQVEQTARDCYKSLAGSDWNNDIQSQGKFLDADVFELWQYPTDWTAKWENFNQENQHVIILLFPANQNIKEISDKIAKVYFDFMRLLCYRHKVNFAYYQGCRLRAEIKKKYAKVRTFRKEISPQLREQQPSLKQLRKNLTQALTDLSDYTESLNKLESQIRTIDRNFKNYQLRQKNFTNPDDKKSPLEFILDASKSDFTPDKYKEQLETDLANLSPALKLLENLIRNIEGIIEIEQTKSEQNLTIIVGFGGIGLAASGITATILSTQIPNPNPHSKEGMPVDVAFRWSILIFIPFLILLLIRFFRR